MRSDAPNETIVGQLTMDLEGIQAQIETLRATFRDSARDILTSEQVAALVPIEGAVALAAAARQAVALNLVAGGDAGVFTGLA